MSSHRKCERMTVETAALPAELGRHWVKRLARLMGVPTETARHWAFRKLPDTRRQEIASAMLAECDRLEQVLANTRRRWEGVRNAADSSVARGKAAEARSQDDRVGREIKP